MPYKKYEDSVDQILENLKQQQPAPKNDSAVDNILAGLGFESARPVQSVADQRAAQACAAPTPKTAAQPAQKAASAQPVQKAQPMQPAQRVQAAVPQAPAADMQGKNQPAGNTVRRTIRRVDAKAKPVAPTAPTQQQEAPIPQEEPLNLRSRFEEAAVQDEGPIEPPSFQVSDSLHVNELIDEEFTRFFSESVAVMPEDEEESGHHHSLFNRFIRKRKAERNLEDEEETIVVPDRNDLDQADTGRISLDLTDAEDAWEQQENHSIQLDFDQQDDDYDEDSYDEGEYEEEPRRAKRYGFGLRLFGNREEEPEDQSGEAETEFSGPFEAEEEYEEPEDYESPEDAPAVQADLAGMRAGWGVRTAISAILSVVLLYLGLTATGILPAIEAIDPQRAPVPYLGVNLIFLLGSMALAWDVMRDGIVGVAGCPSGQTMPMLAAVGSAIQLVVLMIKGSSYEPDKMTLFAAPAALMLCLALLGRAIMAGVVERNFRIVSQGVDHAASYRVRSRELTEKVAQGLGEEEPQLLVSRPTTLVKDFLRQSFSQAPSDGLAQKLSWALLAVSLLAGGVCMIKTQDVITSVSVLAGTLALGGPLCSTLLAAIPCLMMQKSAARVGAVVPGWSAVEELGSANMVMVDAQDIFPQKSVLLHGIKTFEKERIDLAILYAASILLEACDTLQDVFMSIIQGKKDMLYPVENLTCEVGCGFTGWIDHNRVIIGNRRMMEKHEIELPSLDYEERYTKGVRQPIYLAVSGKLFGMFVVSYHADEQVSKVLESLHHAGISVLVKSDDFSVTGELVESVYNLPEGSVKVLSEQDRKDLAPATAYLPQSEGCLTHMGTFASMVGGLQAAEGAAGGERSASVVQAVGVGISCVLALLLTITGGLVGLALPAVILYQVAWSALVLAMPLLKKY